MNNNEAYFSLTKKEVILINSLTLKPLKALLHQ